MDIEGFSTKDGGRVHEFGDLDCRFKLNSQDHQARGVADDNGDAHCQSLPCVHTCPRRWGY